MMLFLKGLPLFNKLLEYKRITFNEKFSIYKYFNIILLKYNTGWLNYRFSRKILFKYKTSAHNSNILKLRMKFFIYFY